MRELGRYTLVLVVATLLSLPLVPVSLGEGGVDPRVPTGTYPAEDAHPLVYFQNDTIERGEDSELMVTLDYSDDGSYGRTINVILEIYRWASYDEERELSTLSGTLPTFRYFDAGANATVDSLLFKTGTNDPDQSDGWKVLTTVHVPADAPLGYYRVRVQIDMGPEGAGSMGHFTVEEWEESLDRVARGEPPLKYDYVVSEGGFSVVPRGYDTVRLPNRVPDLGNFTTPVIRPGETGTYNFTVTNRYDLPMTDVSLEVEFYMWATIEEAKALDRIDGPPPRVEGTRLSRVTVALGDLPPGGTKPVVVVISTREDTPKGTYFVRHRITFTYNGTAFTMASRGYFTREQWEGFDYTNLQYQLGTAGIIPDSSFSVKDPVPIWPLATLIALCVLFGALAVVFYLAEEHGDQYPRLKGTLQRLTGRWEQRKRLWQQRLDELRGEVDVPLEEEDA